MRNPSISPTAIPSTLLRVTNVERVTPTGRSLEPSMRSNGTHFEFCGCSLSEPPSPSSDPRAPKGAHCGSCGILMIILPFYVRCVLRRYHDFSPLCTLTLHIYLLLYLDHLLQHVRWEIHIPIVDTHMRTQHLSLAPRIQTTRTKTGARPAISCVNLCLDSYRCRSMHRNCANFEVKYSIQMHISCLFRQIQIKGMWAWQANMNYASMNGWRIHTTVAGRLMRSIPTTSSQIS